MIRSPCYVCVVRHVGCHDQCEAYRQYRELKRMETYSLAWDRQVDRVQKVGRMRTTNRKPPEGFARDNDLKEE